MFIISKEIEFDSAHRLLNYNGPCSVIHGHRYVVSMHFAEKSLDDVGFVIDFAEVKKEVKEWIDYNWDHGAILNEEDPLVKFLVDMKQKVYTLPCNPTAENIAFELFTVFKPIFNSLCSVTVWETPTSQAEYSP